LLKAKDLTGSKSPDKLFFAPPTGGAQKPWYFLNGTKEKTACPLNFL